MKRILSLDGGGTFAGVHARTLGKLYGANTPGREIVRKFDFIAANSGGAIVLAALCCNYTPEQIAALYNDPATLRRMFGPKWVNWIPLLRNVLPRYSACRKYRALIDIFDCNRQLIEPNPSVIKLSEWPEKYLKSEVNLIITAFDYDRERAAFFRSNLKSLARSSAPALEDATLVQAVHASTNAPILYFDKPAEVCGRRFWDGGMGGYDNPVLAATVEALANYPEGAADMRVLSLGVGAVVRPEASEDAPPPIGKKRDSTCLLSAVKKAATVIIDEPPDAASFQAHVALRQPIPKKDEHGNLSVPAESGNLVRLCPLIRPIRSPGGWKLPAGLCAEDFLELVEMKLDVMSKHQLGLIRRMCDLWMADALCNQPIRMGIDFQCEIGQDTFSEAAAHWESIS